MNKTVPSSWNASRIDGAKIKRKMRIKRVVFALIAIIVLVSAAIAARILLQKTGAEARTDLQRTH